MERRSREQIEDEYYQRVKQLNRMEEELSDYNNEFQQRTNHYIDLVFQAFKGVDATDERNRFIYQLEDSKERYLRQYSSDIESIELERQNQYRLFQQRLEEANDTVQEKE